MRQRLGHRTTESEPCPLFSPAPPTRLEHWLRPARVLALSFLAAIFVGTGLLATPWAAAGPPLGVVDALFTATSATCVTGLVVVDTGARFSWFGEVVVLTLIQLGGLGIMTYSSLVLLAMGERISFRGEAVLRDTLAQPGPTPPPRMVRNVFLFTFACEALGVVALYLCFYPRMANGAALYHAVFHSVSAFCNAGFSLYPDSLVAYRGHWGINLTVMALITAGGLGFVVLEDVAGSLSRLWRRGKARLHLHTKVVLWWSVGLTLGGALGIFLFELRNILAGLPWREKLLVSLFQSVTARTAGFNTVDYGALTDVSLFLTMGLMFVGASPGSCGGGVKTTSAAVVMALFASRMCGRSRASLFRRTVPDAVVSRVVTIYVASFLLICGAVFLLTLVEITPRPHRGETAVFLDALFESVSAFGTVGLSTGFTTTLSVGGKLVLTLLMFIGRLGPLTLAMAIGRAPVRSKIAYAEENLMVG